MAMPLRTAGTTLRRPATALLVEDEESLRHLLARALTEDGFVVVEAANGEEALQVARALDGQINVVITDISMPVMDGLEFARSFQPLYPKVPILFMTGNHSITSVALRRGVEENLLRKPFSPDDLLAAVLRTIDRAPDVGRTSA
jgi:two-component system cell cycle sensor histidine kinase/response regulator CckA